jgi:hypothetical protein
VSFLLPQERVGTVRAVRAVDIHGDRYLDLSVAFEGGDPGVQVGRVPSGECPAGLRPGDRVAVRFVMGVMVKVARAREPGLGPG